jgi:hypothetical protein
MTETDRINEGFIYLFSKLGNSANDRDNPNAKDGKELDIRRLLNRLYEIGFADRKENVQRTMGSNGIVYDYWINSKGVHFIDTLPKEFKDQPYSYYLKLEEEEKALKKTRDDLDEKVKKITLNNSRFQKYTPIVSAIIAGLSLISTIILSISKSEKPYIPLKEMQQLEKTQEKINKSIEQYLDTLRVHQK